MSIQNFSLHKIYFTSFKSKFLVYSYILQNGNVDSIGYISKFRRYCKQSSTKNQKKLAYKIQTASLKDVPEITELIRTAYLPNDPVIKSYKFTEKANEQLLKVILSTLYEDVARGYTLIAKNSVPKLSPEIYGVALCGINTPETNFVKGKKANVQNAGLRHLLRLWHHVAEKPCLFTQYKVNEIFEIAFVTTHPLAQNQGIGTHLVKEAINIAKKKDIKLVRIDASNFFTSLMCMKLGMKEIYKVYFNEYIDSRDNLKLRKVEHPHKSFVTYVLDLKKESDKNTLPIISKEDNNLKLQPTKSEGQLDSMEKNTADPIHAKMALLATPITEHIPYNSKASPSDIFEKDTAPIPQVSETISEKSTPYLEKHSLQDNEHINLKSSNDNDMYTQKYVNNSEHYQWNQWNECEHKTLNPNNEENHSSPHQNVCKPSTATHVCLHQRNDNDQIQPTDSQDNENQSSLISLTKDSSNLSRSPDTNPLHQAELHSNMCSRHPNQTLQTSPPKSDIQNHSIPLVNISGRFPCAVCTEICKQSSKYNKHTTQEKTYVPSNISEYTNYKDSIHKVNLEPLKELKDMSANLKSLSTQNIPKGAIKSLYHFADGNTNHLSKTKDVWLLEAGKKVPSIDSIKNQIMKIEDKKHVSSITGKLPKEIESLILHFLSDSESTTTKSDEIDRNVLNIPSSNHRSKDSEKVGDLIETFYASNRNVIQKLITIPQKNYDEGTSNIYRVTVFKVRKNKNGDIENISLSPEHYTFINDMTKAADDTLKSTSPGKYMILLEKILRKIDNHEKKSGKNIDKQSNESQDQSIYKSSVENIAQRNKESKINVDQLKDQLKYTGDDTIAKEYSHIHKSTTSDQKYLIKTTDTENNVSRGNYLQEFDKNRKEHISDQYYDVSGTQQIKNDVTQETKLKRYNLDKFQQEIANNGNNPDCTKFSQQKNFENTVLDLSRFQNTNEVSNVIDVKNETRDTILRPVIDCKPNLVENSEQKLNQEIKNSLEDTGNCKIHVSVEQKEKSNGDAKQPQNQCDHNSNSKLQPKYDTSTIKQSTFETISNPPNVLECIHQHNNTVGYPESSLEQYYDCISKLHLKIQPQINKNPNATNFEKLKAKYENHKCNQHDHSKHNDTENHVIESTESRHDILCDNLKHSTDSTLQSISKIYQTNSNQSGTDQHNRNDCRKQECFNDNTIPQNQILDLINQQHNESICSTVHNAQNIFETNVEQSNQPCHYCNAFNKKYESKCSAPFYKDMKSKNCQHDEHNEEQNNPSKQIANTKDELKQNLTHHQILESTNDQHDKSKGNVMQNIQKAHLEQSNAKLIHDFHKKCPNEYSNLNETDSKKLDEKLNNIKQHTINLEEYNSEYGHPTSNQQGHSKPLTTQSHIWESTNNQEDENYSNESKRKAIKKILKLILDRNKKHDEENILDSTKNHEVEGEKSEQHSFQPKNHLKRDDKKKSLELTNTQSKELSENAEQRNAKLENVLKPKLNETSSIMKSEQSQVKHDQTYSDMTSLNSNNIHNKVPTITFAEQSQTENPPEQSTLPNILESTHINKLNTTQFEQDQIHMNSKDNINYDTNNKKIELISTDETKNSSKLEQSQAKYNQNIDSKKPKTDHLKNDIKQQNSSQEKQEQQNLYPNESFNRNLSKILKLKDKDCSKAESNLVQTDDTNRSKSKHEMSKSKLETQTTVYNVQAKDHSNNITEQSNSSLKVNDIVNLNKFNTKQEDKVICPTEQSKQKLSQSIKLKCSDNTGQVSSSEQTFTATRPKSVHDILKTWTDINKPENTKSSRDISKSDSYTVNDNVLKKSDIKYDNQDFKHMKQCLCRSQTEHCYYNCKNIKDTTKANKAISKIVDANKDENFNEIKSNFKTLKHVNDSKKSGQKSNQLPTKIPISHEKYWNSEAKVDDAQDDWNICKRNGLISFIDANNKTKSSSLKSKKKLRTHQSKIEKSQHIPTKIGNNDLGYLKGGNTKSSETSSNNLNGENRNIQMEGERNFLTSKSQENEKYVKSSHNDQLQKYDSQTSWNFTKQNMQKAKEDLVRATNDITEWNDTHLKSLEPKQTDIRKVDAYTNTEEGVNDYEKKDTDRLGSNIKVPTKRTKYLYENAPSLTDAAKSILDSNKQTTKNGGYSNLTRPAKNTFDAYKTTNIYQSEKADLPNTTEMSNNYILNIIKNNQLLKIPNKIIKTQTHGSKPLESTGRLDYNNRIYYAPKYSRGIENINSDLNQTKYAANLNWIKNRESSSEDAITSVASRSRKAKLKSWYKYMNSNKNQKNNDLLKVNPNKKAQKKYSQHTGVENHSHVDEEVNINLVNNKTSSDAFNSQNTPKLFANQIETQSKSTKLGRTRSQTNTIKEININQFENFGYTDMQPRIAHLVEVIMKSVQDLNQLTTSQLKLPASYNKTIKTRWIEESGYNFEDRDEDRYKVNLENIVSIRKNQKRSSENTTRKPSELIIRFAPETDSKKKYLGTNED